VIALSASAASFLIGLGFAVPSEDLKFAGASALASTVVWAALRQLSKLRREERRST
jgi:hypothetical protein